MKSDDLLAVLLFGTGMTSTAIATLTRSRGGYCYSQFTWAASTAVAWGIVDDQISNRATSSVVTAAGFVVTAAGFVVTAAGFVVTAAGFV
ncbi:MAG: hypothetical protein ACR2NZ_17680, partial [Rubripirellula sp.]